MLILINAICSFMGAFLGCLAYGVLTLKKNLKEVQKPLIEPDVYYAPGFDHTESKPKAIKRKPRTADEIARARDLAKTQEKAFIDQMQERVIVVQE